MPPSDLPLLRVLLAPALRADRALSMDLYTEELLGALAEFRERVRFRVVAPVEGAVEGISRFRKQWLRYHVYPRTLRRELVTERAAAGNAPVLVHVLDHSYGHLCRTVATAGFPVVASCHGLENYHLRLRWPWHQALWTHRVRGLGQARRVSAISDAVARDAIRFVPLPPERVEVNRYGLHPAFVPAAVENGGGPREQGAAGPAVNRLAALRRAGRRLVLHVGMNVARKNIPTLLGALTRLQATGLPVTFVKVGSDPRRDGLAEAVAALGPEGFEHLGWLSPAETAAVCRGCDVLAFPSIHEGFGRPLIEAQGCGLPVVASDTPSAREVAGPDGGALFHAPTDPDDLAAKLRLVLEDAKTRRALIAGGLANARRYSWRDHARAMVTLYEAVAAGR